MANYNVAAAVTQVNFANVNANGAMTRNICSGTTAGATTNNLFNGLCSGTGAYRLDINSGAHTTSGSITTNIANGLAPGNQIINIGNGVSSGASQIRCGANTANSFVRLGGGIAGGNTCFLEIGVNGNSVSAGRVSLQGAADSQIRIQGADLALRADTIDIGCTNHLELRPGSSGRLQFFGTSGGGNVQYTQSTGAAASQVANTIDALANANPIDTTNAQSYVTLNTTFGDSTNVYTIAQVVGALQAYGLLA